MSPTSTWKACPALARRHPGQPVCHGTGRTAWTCPTTDRHGTSPPKAPKPGPRGRSPRSRTTSAHAGHRLALLPQEEGNVGRPPEIQWRSMRSPTGQDSGPSAAQACAGCAKPAVVGRFTGPARALPTVSAALHAKLCDGPASTRLALASAASRAGSASKPGSDERS